MPRPPRLQVPGGVYHVTSRGVARQALFRDDADRQRFLQLTADVVGRCGWACHAFCLMTTHYHLLIRTPTGNLAHGMQRLNSCYAQEFNRRHGETGHRLERRYNAVLASSEPHTLELVRYLALNPVRAGNCVRPEDWPWSSYPAFVGRATPPRFLAVEWLLTQFGSNRDRSIAALRAFVEDLSPSAGFVKGSDPGR